jgi:hypothetical protein
MKEKWTSLNYYNERNKEKISKIIKIEWELTEAIRNGHKAFWGDEFREKRNEMLQLRKELLENK